MTTINNPIKYINGNCIVTIKPNGTKIREWPDNQEPRPNFPESVDLKITNQCTNNCKWCHEKSSPNGEHATVKKLKHVLSPLPSGVEIAIGGGNPLLFPNLKKLLHELNKHGLIPNITINALELISKETPADVFNLVNGIGLSNPSMAHFLIENNHTPKTPNLVCHAIVGVDDPFTIFDLLRTKHKTLLLGYKKYGRGKKFYNKWVKRNIDAWKFFIPEMLKMKKSILAFDNLALKQLNIKTLIGENNWNKYYMGDDGQFTMYYDAVTNKYAKSSTDTRYDAKNMNIIEMFNELRKYKRQPNKK